MHKLIFQIIRAVFFAFACVVWVVIGMPWWIAVLLRALTIFTIAFLAALFKREDVPSVVGELEQLAAIWPNGFRQAWEQFYGKPSSGPRPKPDLWRLLVESGFTIILVGFVALGAIGSSWGTTLLFLVAALVAFGVGVGVVIANYDYVKKFLRIPEEEQQEPFT